MMMENPDFLRDYAACMRNVARGQRHAINMVNGLTHLYLELTESGTDTKDIEHGLGMWLFASSEPVREIQLHSGTAFLLMASFLRQLEARDPEDAEVYAECWELAGNTMLELKPNLPFEEKLLGVEQAFAIVGQRAAGKGTVLGFLQEKGIKIIPSSKPLREVAWMDKREKALTPDLIDLGIELKEKYGYGVLIRWALRMITSQYSDHSQVAMDGLRTVEEIKYFRELFGDKATVVAVEAPVEMVWPRVLARQEKTGRVDFKTYEDFLNAWDTESERINQVMKMADISFTNDKGVKEIEEFANSLV